ncbi:hypothetical protein PM082_007962 [Marasmius tenuissimus]|nr:hypothetical protein PM082_007962 [Marasmius tenuissimus]
MYHVSSPRLLNLETRVHQISSSRYESARNPNTSLPIGYWPDLQLHASPKRHTCTPHSRRHVEISNPRLASSGTPTPNCSTPLSAFVQVHSSLRKLGSSTTVIQRSASGLGWAEEDFGTTRIELRMLYGL